MWGNGYQYALQPTSKISIDILTKWLDSEKFRNVKWSSDSRFVIADGENKDSNIFIVIQIESEFRQEKYIDQVLEFGREHDRQCWFADIEEHTRKITWEFRFRNKIT